MSEDGGYRWKEYGVRIREARKQAGLTQKRLAELVGVGAHTVWCWEAGRMRPNRENLVALAFHTGSDIHVLEGRDTVEAELLKDAVRSFSDALDGLSREDIESIHRYVRFVRSERRRLGSGGR